MLSVSVTKHHPGFDLRASFELPTPGVAALFGRSGCGKSTLVDIIAGLAAPDGGCIELDQVVLLDTHRKVCVSAERRRIGYVFQDARLFPHLRVSGNLRYASTRATGAAYVAFDTVVGLLDLGPLMERRTHQLSGGERQRVAIGRALLTQPRLLLLDEPLAALDNARREEVLPYLETLRDQLAIPMVYVTHRFEEVMRLATHLVLMDTGSVIAQGNVAELSLDPRLRAIIGPDEVGALVDGEVIGVDSGTKLTRVRIGNGELHVPGNAFPAGAALRVQLLARDIIVSTRLPDHLSVRNALAGRITAIQADDETSDLITIDIGGSRVMARITAAATAQLSLHTGMPVWALVKSVSLRGQSFGAPKPAAFRDA